MRTRGFHRWHTDRPILLLLHPTYTLVDDDDGGRMAGFEAGGRSSVGLGGSGGMVGPAGSAGVTSVGIQGGDTLWPPNRTLFGLHALNAPCIIVSRSSALRYITWYPC